MKNRTQRGEEMFAKAENHPFKWLSKYLLLPGRALTEAVYMPISREESRGYLIFNGLVLEAIKVGIYSVPVANKLGEYFAQ